jgi:hypothetical protein
LGSVSLLGRWWWSCGEAGGGDWVGVRVCRSRIPVIGSWSSGWTPSRRRLPISRSAGRFRDVCRCRSRGCLVDSGLGSKGSSFHLVVLDAGVLVNHLQARGDPRVMTRVRNLPGVRALALAKQAAARPGDLGRGTRCLPQLLRDDPCGSLAEKRRVAAGLNVVDG